MQACGNATRISPAKQVWHSARTSEFPVPFVTRYLACQEGAKPTCRCRLWSQNRLWAVSVQPVDRTPRSLSLCCTHIVIARSEKCGEGQMKSQSIRLMTDSRFHCSPPLTTDLNVDKWKLWSLKGFAPSLDHLGKFCRVPAETRNVLKDVRSWSGHSRRSLHQCKFAYQVVLVVFSSRSP